MGFFVNRYSDDEIDPKMPIGVDFRLPSGASVLSAQNWSQLYSQGNNFFDGALNEDEFGAAIAAGVAGSAWIGNYENGCERFTATSAVGVGLGATVQIATQLSWKHDAITHVPCSQSTHQQLPHPQ